MSGNKASRIDDRLVEGLTGSQKIRALLSAKSDSVSRWAVNHGFIPEQVFMCLSGAREYPDIRDALAADLWVTREAIDEALNGKTVEQVA